MSELQCVESTCHARVKRITCCIEFDYLKSKHIPVDQCISSPRISVGGYDWVVDFYLNGLSDSVQGHNAKGSHVSLYLRLLSEAKEVSADFSFDLVSKMGKPFPFQEPISHIFTSRHGDCGIWGYPQFISRDKIEADYCNKDGMLAI